MCEWGNISLQGKSFRYLWSKLLRVSIYEIINKINWFVIVFQVKTSVSYGDLIMNIFVCHEKLG